MAILTWFGSVFGITGAFILALNNKHSKWGFVLFLLSDLCWIVNGINTHNMPLTTMDVMFTITSVIGIKRYFFPSVDKKTEN